MLISFSGLPGVGKSTIACLLAQRISATVLRIDIVDQKLVEIGFTPVRDESYRICQALAEDNLRLGRTIIADCVNDMEVTRADWRAAAARAGVKCLEVEIICTDQAAHRGRVETRVVDIPGLALPTWEKITARASEPWSSPRLVIDTANTSAVDAAALIAAEVAAI